MNVLITGITGFLGRHLARYLRESGEHVGGLSRRGSDFPAELAGVPIWMITDDPASLQSALDAFKPDVVVHLAALYVAEHRPDDVVPLIRANVEYGARLLEAMAASGCDAMVYAGTSWQHYEGAEYRPVNLYAATKQAFSTLAEFYRDTAGLRLLELHLYDSYGEDDPRKNLTNLLKNCAGSAETVAMSPGEQRLHLIHVDDVAHGLVLACREVLELDRGDRRIFRLPSARTVDLHELVDLFNGQSPGRPVEVEWGGRPYRKREVFQPWEGAPCLPGWSPTIDLATGIDRLTRPVVGTESH